MPIVYTLGIQNEKKPKHIKLCHIGSFRPAKVSGLSHPTCLSTERSCELEWIHVHAAWMVHWSKFTKGVFIIYDKVGWGSLGL